MTNGLLDRIYECSFAPELWPETLDEIARGVGAIGAALSITVEKGVLEGLLDRSGVYWTASEAARESIVAMAEPRFAAASYGDRIASAGQHHRFFGENEVFSDDDYEREPMLRDLFVPLGMKWGVGTIFRPPVGAHIVFCLRRRTELGPFNQSDLDWLDGLRPHLARSTLVASRLQLERARAAAQTLAALGLPALLCDEDGVVFAANTLIEEGADFIRWQAADRFSFRDGVANQQLRQSMGICLDAKPDVRSFPVRDAEGVATKVAHVLPILRSARDIFSRSRFALILTPVVAPAAPPIELIQSLFDLTPSEAAVATGLARGRTVESMAEDGKVSPNTIRTHVRGVLDKTGSRRQADVIALLSGLSVTRGGSADGV